MGDINKDRCDDCKVVTEVDTHGDRKLCAKCEWKIVRNTVTYPINRPKSLV